MTAENLHLLVIDDSLEDRAVYKRLIQDDPDHKYLILEAETGNEGLELIRSNKTDCVLMDYNLPDMDGIEILTEVFNDKNLKQIPVIFLTGQGSETVAAQAMKSGATDYLMKRGLTGELLKRTIQHAIEKKHADRILQEHFSFLDTLIDTIPNPIFFYKDSKGIITGCNKALEVLLGISEEDIVGKSVYDLALKEVADTAHEMDLKLFEQPGVQSYETTLQDSTGKLRRMIVYKATYPDMSGNIKGLVCSMLDITERKQAEDALKQSARDLEMNVSELKKANRQIIEQQKTLIEEERLKVLLQMAGATAHELNQPLTALLGNIQLLAMDKDKPEKNLQYINKIEMAGHKISGIVKKIQTIRYNDVKPETEKLNSLSIDQAVNILSVEDTDEDFNRLRAILDETKQVKLLRAKDSPEAGQILEKEPVDIVFLDYLLPSCTGLDFLHEMETKGIDVPMVLVTGQGDEIIASRAIQDGAYDYLPKTKISPTSVSRVISSTLEKYRLKKEIKETMKKMAEMSTRDELTGLYNRRYFMEVLERETAGVQRHGNELVLCIMDLDHFKKVNDTYGHPAGDAVLRGIGRFLQERFRKTDIPCRYGGEEFAVIFPNTSLENAYLLCEQFRKTIENHTVDYQGATLQVTVSIGLATYTAASEEFSDDVLKQADNALYAAKNEGRNRVLPADFPLKKQCG